MTDEMKWVFETLNRVVEIGQCHFVSESVLNCRIQIGRDPETKELYGIIPEYAQRQAKEQGYVIEYADFRKGRLCYRRLK